MLLNLFIISILSTTLVTAQTNCPAANECEALVEPNCLPPGGCERLCGQRIICRRLRRRCYCRSGYVRDVTGMCIPRINCPRACTDFECPNHNPRCSCEAFCQPRAVCIVSPSGCHCARGFGRDDRNSCVPLTMCPRPTPARPSSSPTTGPILLN